MKSSMQETYWKVILESVPVEKGRKQDWERDYLGSNVILTMSQVIPQKAQKWRKLFRVLRLGEDTGCLHEKSITLGPKFSLDSGNFQRMLTAESSEPAAFSAMGEKLF